MKKTTFRWRSLFIAMCMLIGCLSSAVAQSQTVSVNLKNGTLQELFSSIEKQSNYRFSYRNVVLDKQQNVTIDMKNAKVSEVLNTAIAGRNLNFAIISDKSIVISDKVIAATTAAKKGSVRGIVIDENDQPMIAVKVSIAGTNTVILTDVNGAYDIPVSKGNELVFEFMGYQTAKQSIDNQEVVDMKMRVDALSLEAAVVVGYGTVKKKDLTGAVSSVKFDDAPMTTFSSVSQALAGKAAGLQVATISAQPGGATNFNIRGATSINASNAPLVVIDGFPVSGTSEPSSGNRYDGGPKDNVLASLNPNDIASVVILKDASATAIYGARAGHGVILVTTKRGKEGKVKIEYSGNFAIQNVANRVETLNSSDWMNEYNRYQRERYIYDNKMGVYSKGGNSKPVDWSGYKGNRFSDSEIASPKYNTDWVDDILRQGFQQQHSLTMSGGSEKTKYLTSINFFDQKGVIKSNDMQRFNARVNLDQQISKIFKAGLSLTLNQNSFKNVPIGGGQNEGASILVAATNSAPIRPIRDENGVYTLNPQAGYLPNSSSLLEIDDNSKLDRVLANAFIEAMPVQDLRLKASFGFDRNMTKRKTYLPKTTLYGQKANGEAFIGTQESSDYLFEFTADYNKTIGKSRITGLLGYSFQDMNGEGVNAGNSDFLIDGWKYNNLAAGAFTKPTVGSWANKSQMSSFFARLNYIYDDRYYLTATVRADGASNLAQGNQWGYFPSVALAWNISSEKFFAPAKNVVTQMKLRASYGQTGNSNVGNKARDYYSLSGEYIFGGVVNKGVGIGQIGNKSLTWETTSEVNVGLDVEFAGRVNLTAEYYDRTVSNLLSTRNLMSYQEIGSIAANIGKTQSRGFELTISSQNIVKGDFRWSTDLTFSLYRDRWLERDPTWKPSAYQSSTDFIRSSFGYLSDGLIQPSETGNIAHMPGAVAGQVKLKDVDSFKRDASGNIVYGDDGRAIKTGQADGKLDDADKVFHGNWDPGYIFGMNNTFSYKNWDLNIYIYGQADKLMSGSWKTGADVERIYTDYGMPVTQKQMWSSENQDQTYYGLFQSASSYGTGDYLHKKVWYIRVRNITLGYTIPFKNNKIIQGARIFVDVNNPFLFTNYEGLDPETDSWTGGIAAYPNVRTYSLGLNITF